MQASADTLNDQSLFISLAQKLTENIPVKKVIDTVDQLHLLYSKLTRVEGVLAPAEQEEIFEEVSENGTRVNPYMAAYCFLDYLRSYKFALGIRYAVDDLLKARPQAPVRILYAGTGPYAALVLPLTTVFSADQINITLIDIHQSSLDAVKKLVAGFGLQAYFSDYIKTDATCFEPPANQQYDLIISETMDKSLRKEPQVTIFNHLQKFLAPGGELIPQEIRVDLYQSDWGKEKQAGYEYYLDETTRIYNAGHRKQIANLISVNKDTVPYFKRTIAEPRVFLKTVGPDQFDLRYDALILLTEVQVYKNITLVEDESILTEKNYLSPLNDGVIKSGLSFYYKMDDEPRIVFN